MRVPVDAAPPSMRATARMGPVDAGHMDLGHAGVDVGHIDLHHVGPVDVGDQLHGRWSPITWAPIDVGSVGPR